MGSKLFPYIVPKVHSLIQSHDFNHILVHGHHIRKPPSIITTNEKADKPFNFQRPTATISSSSPSSTTLNLNVLPGIAYVEHYAAILATYFTNCKGRNTPFISYILPEPNVCVDLFATSNLKFLGKVDIAIIGYVDSLTHCTGPGAWETGPQDQQQVGRSTPLSEEEISETEEPLFAWKKRTLPNGRTVVFLGCKACYWGDIGGQLILSLYQRNGIREAIYIGKLGTLSPQYIPNSILATGSTSIFPKFPSTNIKWTNILEKAIVGSEKIVKDGVHITVSTSLCETNEWAKEWRGKADWVDPEIGHMAKVCVENGMGFGYLHVVSDNLSRIGLEGLVDERKASIVADRKKLLQEVERVLERYFDEDK